MIHICYGLYDKSGSYSKFVGTSICSIFENTNADCTIHILHDNTLSLDNRDKFIYLAGKYNQQIKFYNVEQLCTEQLEIFKKKFAKVQNTKYSIATLYRMLIPQIFSTEIDKVIYLDADIIVNLDIFELWRVELGKKFLAAAPECELDVFHEQRIFSHYLITCGKVKQENYFNAGVMLLNLKKFRKDKNILDGGIDFVLNNPKCLFFDQDIFNYCFANDYIKLPENFDVFVKSEIVREKNSKTRDAIYHYAENILNFDINNALNNLWFSYFEKTAWFNKNIFLNLHDGAKQFSNEIKNFALQMTKILPGKKRAFFMTQANLQVFKQIFAIAADEEIIFAESENSIQQLQQSFQNSQGKKFFFILVANYPAVHQSLSAAGLNFGKDFVNGLEILPTMQGGIFDSHRLLKNL